MTPANDLGARESRLDATWLLMAFLLFFSWNFHLIGIKPLSQLWCPLLAACSRHNCLPRYLGTSVGTCAKISGRPAAALFYFLLQTTNSRDLLASSYFATFSAHCKCKKTSTPTRTNQPLSEPPVNMEVDAASEHRSRAKQLIVGLDLGTTYVHA